MIEKADQIFVLLDALAGEFSCLQLCSSRLLRAA